MKKFFQEKSWYFALVVLGWVIQPIFEQIVLFSLVKKGLTNGGTPLFLFPTLFPGRFEAY